MCNILHLYTSSIGHIQIFVEKCIICVPRGWNVALVLVQFLSIILCIVCTGDIFNCAIIV